MNPEQIDYDTATEDELAALRGDNLETEAEQTSEVEDKAESEEGEDVSAAQEDKEQASEQGDETVSGADESVDKAEDEAAEEDTPASPEAKDEQTSFMIPKSRYDAVMARLKEAEAKNQETPEPEPAQEQETEDPTAARLAEIDAEIAAAVNDGQGDKLPGLMAEQRNLQQARFNAQLQETSQQSSAQAIEQVKYDNLVEMVEKFIPETNPDGENYDVGMVVEVQDLKAAFESRGYSSSDALIKALNYVKPGWDQADAEVQSEAETQDQAERAEEKPAPEPKKTEVKKNIEDAKATPPRMDEGANSDAAGRGAEIDVMKLSDEEFAKLSEEQLARMRGDEA